MKINTLAEGEQLRKYHVALLVNKGTSDKPEWVQIEKSTDNTITMNAETEDRDFIVDTSATTVLQRYKPSLSEPITLFKGNPDYEFFWKDFFNQAVGSSAVHQMLIIFMNEDSGDKYEAWVSDASFVMDNLNPVDGILTVTINFNGTTKKGYVTIADGVPSFTEGEIPADSGSAETKTAETPVFTNTLSDANYAKDADASALDGTATVSDGGTVTYSWSDGTSIVGTEATYKPDTSEAGEKTYTVTATNTLDGVTATATQSVKVTVTE